jgi:hypothetical protein
MNIRSGKLKGEQGQENDTTSINEVALCIGLHLSECGINQATTLGMYPVHRLGPPIDLSGPVYMQYVDNLIGFTCSPYRNLL